MLCTCGSTAAEEYIPFLDLVYKKLLWSFTGWSTKNNKFFPKRSSRKFVDHHWSQPVSKNPWTCLKNQGLCQVPISFSFPGSQQSTKLPVITTAWWMIGGSVPNIRLSNMWVGGHMCSAADFLVLINTRGDLNMLSVNLIIMTIPHFCSSKPFLWSRPGTPQSVRHRCAPP